MKAYRLEVLVVDFDGLGGAGVRGALENVRFPNDCISPSIMSVEERDIGPWSDDHPLNRTSTAKAEYERLFALPAAAPEGARVPDGWRGLTDTEIDEVYRVIERPYSTPSRRLVHDSLLYKLRAVNSAPPPDSAKALPADAAEGMRLLQLVVDAEHSESPTVRAFHWNEMRAFIHRLADAASRTPFPSEPAAAEAVGYVNGDELDNMLDDRTATIQGKPSNDRRTPLYAGPHADRANALPTGVTYYAETREGQQHDTGRVYLRTPGKPHDNFFADTASPEDARLIAEAMNALAAPSPQQQGAGVACKGDSQRRCSTYVECAAAGCKLGLAPAQQQGAEPVASQAARDVLAERKRQISVEGWTPEHDDEHTTGEMAVASACYALAATLPIAENEYWRNARRQAAYALWPWDREWWKPTFADPRRMLVKAAALILAEIERLDRGSCAADRADWRMRVAAIAAECTDPDAQAALDKLLEDSL